MKRHAFGMSPARYFEASERESYDIFSRAAAMAGRASCTRGRICDGTDTASVRYNPIRVARDILGSEGVWDVHLSEEVLRIASPVVVTKRSLPMLVTRSLTVMNVDEAGIGFCVDEIGRPPVYRSDLDGDILLEVAEADVEFTDLVDPPLSAQARYMGWISLAEEFASSPQRSR